MSEWLLCAKEGKKFAPDFFEGDIHMLDDKHGHDRFKGFPASPNEKGVWQIHSPELVNAELLRIQVPFKGGTHD